MAVLATLLATSVLPGFHFDTSVRHWWLAAVRLPLIFTVLLILLRPLLLFATLPLNTLTLGFPTLLFNGLILYLAAKFDRAFVITNYGEALLGNLMITVISAGITGWLGLDEAHPFYQSIIYRLGRRFGPRPPRKPLCGLLLLQVDGLSLPSLRTAMHRGRMPALTAMLAKGSHRLYGWRCGLPSNTPAVQAGLFYGDRENVAGYRWYDRKARKVRVVSDPEDLRRLEAMVGARGPGLLAGGSCINTFLSGGADKRLMTVSALGEKGSARRVGERADFNLFFLSPNALTKAVIWGLWDFMAGAILALAGRFDKDRPRLGFSLRRLGQRALANAFLRDLSFFWLKQDMVRGVPVIYSNFVGYDEVAHHSAPDAYEAQITLASFDRRLRILRRRARRQSPIRYEIVLLSDHGQTASVPFRHLYGETIGQALNRMLERLQGPDAIRARVFDPGSSYSLSLLKEMEEVSALQPGWISRRSRRALKRMAAGETGRVSVKDAPQVVVCVSGSLAHVYFTEHGEPLHLEDVVALYPGLIETLARHPGIGFVAASRRFGDAVAICEDGIRNLVTGELGKRNDPLAPFRNRDFWAGELARLLGYPDSGDLVINGAWLPDRGRIVVLEEQSSSHGGLGGPQNEPFVLLPATWDVHDADLASPEALHRLIRREMDRYDGGLEPSDRPGSGI
ncbi:phage holin family protein [bacterium]|nr:phage holin family protein [bacterium]